MPELQEFRLTFPGGLHIGTRGVNLEECRLGVSADTIFAALFEARLKDGGDADAWIAPFPRVMDGKPVSDGQPPFLLSSGFPFVGDLLPDQGD